MKKYLLFFGLLISLLIPANALADPVGGIDIDGDGDSEGVLESVTEESSEEEVINDYLDGDSSVNYDNMDEPIDDYLNESIDRSTLLGHFEAILGGHYNDAFGGGADAFRYDCIATASDSSGCLFWLYYPDRVGETQYELYCRSVVLMAGSEIRSNVSFTVEGTRYSYVQDTSGYGDAEINQTCSNFYSFSMAAGAFSTCTFNSTIPVFDYSSDSLYDDINNYIESFGTDFSGALNEDYVQLAHDRANLGYVTNSDDIPSPQINSIGTFDSNSDDVFVPRNNMSLSLMVPNYEGDSLSYDIQVGAQCTNSSGKDFTLNYKYFYCGHKVNLDSDGYIFDKAYLFNDVTTWIHSCSDISRVNRLYVRVRFRNNLKASNWVQVVYSNGTTSTTAYTQDNDGNYVDGDYNGGTLYSPVDSGYSGSGYLGDNVNYFISFVRSGFGLLDGGLLSLMAATFSYIPASIWDLFKAFIASVVIVTMIVLMVRAVSAIASAVAGIFNKS